jgi:TonB family protein
MKKPITLALLLLTFVCAYAKERNPTPHSTIIVEGDELPFYAPPRLILPKKSVPPRYPDAEKKAAVAGTAVINILVGTDGKVAEVEVIYSEPTSSFGVAARAAALQWRYRPLSREGKATRFIVQMPITFDALAEIPGQQEFGR